jgi:L-amino acid N-acyltransferase YncA
MTAVEVRPADDSDVEAIAAIYVNAARAGWAHIFDEPSLKAIEPPVGRLRAELASTDPRERVLVAEREGRVTAFASFGRLGTRTPTASAWANSTSSTANQRRGAKGSAER